MSVENLLGDLVRSLESNDQVDESVLVSALEGALDRACSILAARGPEIPGFSIKSIEKWKRDLIVEAAGDNLMGILATIGEAERRLEDGNPSGTFALNL